MKLGPSISTELEAAGLLGLAFSLDLDTGEACGRDNLTEAQAAALDAVLAAHDPTQPAPLRPGERVTYPGEFWLRCTEAEAEVIVAASASMPVREQQIFNRATVFDHAVPETQRLIALLGAAFGPERAAELMAPS